MSSEPSDDQLKLLAITAQRHPPLSLERREALGKLFELILPKLGSLRESRFSDEEIYEEAIQNLSFYICKNIEKYNPDRAPFMSWVRMLLYVDFLNKAFDERAMQNKKISSFDSSIEKFYSLDQPPLWSEQLRECIELDAEDIFKKEHIKNHQEANFQSVAKRRFSGESWKDISADWGINIATLNSFYKRCMKKFKAKFQEYMSW